MLLEQLDERRHFQGYTLTSQDLTSTMNTGNSETEIVLIIVTSVMKTVALLAGVFKEGYIAVEVVDEEKPKKPQMAT